MPTRLESRVASCDQHPIQFVEQFIELAGEDLIDSTESALLIEGDVLEVILLDSEAQGDVVLDEGEPLALLIGEMASPVLLLGEPVLEPLLDLLGEGNELAILVERETHEG